MSLNGEAVALKLWGAHRSAPQGAYLLIGRVMTSWKAIWTVEVKDHTIMVATENRTAA